MTIATVKLDFGQVLFIQELVFSDLHRMRQQREHARSHGERNFNNPEEHHAREILNALYSACVETEVEQARKGDPETLPELTELREFAARVSKYMDGNDTGTDLMDAAQDICKRWQLPRPEEIICSTCKGAGSVEGDAGEHYTCEPCKGTGMVEKPANANPTE